MKKIRNPIASLNVRKFMIFTLVSFCFSAFFFAGFPANVSAEALTLAENGKTSWKIVLPDAPQPVESTAARELAEHLQAVTGTEFPIVKESETVSGKDSNGNLNENSNENSNVKSCIFVGNTSHKPQKPWRFDEIYIAAEGGNLILAGHEKRGCLYAVYTFLQDTVGVRWWSPDASFIPKKPVLEIPDTLRVEYAPQVISREMYHRDAQPTVFSARMKGNGFLTEEYGGAVRIVNFVHSFYKYLPPETYFEAHPEWYSEIKGKRTHEHAQLCLTNPEMQKEFIKNFLETLCKNPDAKFIDVSQNDWYGFCECEHCRALDDAEESHAGTLVRFLNTVAEAVEKEFPDVLVESLAYQYTRKPPKTLRPRKNVLIRLCTIECSFSEPLTGARNASFAADIQGWSAIAEHLFIWDYVTNYNDYIGPHPNLRVLAPNIRYFVENGAIGIFEEGEGDDFSEMRNWVLMRLMWDPSLDENVLFDEFRRGYYGDAAAPFIAEYQKILHDRAEETGVYLGCFGANSAQWLDLQTLNRVTEIMNKAETASKEAYGPDSDELARLQKSRMAIDLVWLMRYYPLRCDARTQNLPFLGPQDPFAAASELESRAVRFKTKAMVISQEKNVALFFEGLKGSFLAQKNPPEMCRNLPDDQWLVFDAVSFNNYMNAAEVVDDPHGWNGKSVKMNTKVDWNTSYTPPVRGKYRLYASLRVEGSEKAREGRLGSWGVYCPQEKRGLLSQSLSAEQFLTPDGNFDPGFRWIELGSVDFIPSAYFWFAHGHREELDAIFVDRVLLIAE